LGFSEGYYRVRMHDSTGKRYWAFLNEKCELAFRPNSVIIYDIKDGMALSVRKNMWSKSLQIFGYYDKNGNEVIPHKYDDATDFSEGLAYVFNESENGFIDKTGKMVIPLEDMAGNPFSEGLAPVNDKNFKIGFMDKDGVIKINFKYDEVRPFSEGKTSVHMFGRFAYIDTLGNHITKAVYDFANPFSENYAFVGISEDKQYTAKWGFIDTSGYQAADFKYLANNNFSEGLAVVQTDSTLWGYIDYSDSFVIEPSFNSADSFINGLAWAVKTEDKKYGFINKNAEWVILIERPIKVVDLRLNRRVK